MKNKYCTLEIKDLDQTSGLVTFYFSSFGNVDSYGDVTEKSAFNKSISDGYKRVRHLRNHSEAVGKIKEISTDSKGAFAVSQLAMNTLDGRDTYEQYLSGLITEHSFGYEVVKHEMVGDTRRLKEVKLWEVSSLTHWGANKETETISVKSLFDTMKNIENILSNGKISDKLGEKLEIDYKYIIDNINVAEISSRASTGNSGAKNINNK